LCGLVGFDHGVGGWPFGIIGPPVGHFPQLKILANWSVAREREEVASLEKGLGGHILDEKDWVHTRF